MYFQQKPDSSHYAEWADILSSRLKKRKEKKGRKKKRKSINPIFSSALIIVPEKYALKKPASFHLNRSRGERNLYSTHKEGITFSLDSTLPDEF